LLSPYLPTSYWLIASFARTSSCSYLIRPAPMPSAWRRAGERSATRDGQDGDLTRLIVEKKSTIGTSSSMSSSYVIRTGRLSNPASDQGQSLRRQGAHRRRRVSRAPYPGRKDHGERRPEVRPCHAGRRDSFRNRSLPEGVLYLLRMPIAIRARRRGSRGFTRRCSSTAATG